MQLKKQRQTDHSCSINLDSSSANTPVTTNTTSITATFNSSNTSPRDLYAKVTSGANAIITTLAPRC